MVEYKVSFRYAKALLNLAETNKIAEEVLKDLKYISASLSATAQLRSFVSSPIILHLKKRKILNEVFTGRINQLSLNFVLLLAEKGRESLIRSIAYQYEIQYNFMFNRLPVTIISAIELNELTKSLIINKLTSIFGKTMLPEYKIDKSLIGGIVLQIEDMVYDASIRNQLNALRQSLIEGKKI